MSPTDDETPFPPLSRVASIDTIARSHLSPHDAFLAPLRSSFDAERGRLPAERSRSRRRKHTWKKLMWVKQSYPDNYTDQATFLENLQRNPRLKPYDFWPLVADSTVILQHVCSVILFIVCFVGIFQERLSPVTLVGGSSLGTFLGWIFWERWVWEEERKEQDLARAADAVAPGSGVPPANKSGDSVRRRNRAASLLRPMPYAPRGAAAPPPITLPTITPEGPSASAPHDAAKGLRLEIPPTAASGGGSGGNAKGDGSGSGDANGNVIQDRSSQATTPITPAGPLSPGGAPRSAAADGMPDFADFPVEENRLHQRAGTIKSALLICFTLLGLSPILKSLTLSTSSDSIWAMSFWLLVTNIFFFDYSGGVGAKFPASLSTNAALMASTVLASRLPSTKQVFSLTLFSIEVFGLFPVFRRHIRHRSFRHHGLLTFVLVLGAGWGVGMVIGEPRAAASSSSSSSFSSAAAASAAADGGWPWRRGVAGMAVAVVLATIAAGGCSWWLIRLQKYKNEIRGPWDPARPIIMSRPRWEDR
ncbi:Phosphatidylinositol N-acetylglucosaminyltransferase GPI2 subunit [Escovopsis weberi]|uniref:Phosphatidylinositol N-acetylglucosaminyltransferase GPI2 subunit n=1 Tax=Escovopsis weberi TaxID=150374 RepID=A0A0M8N6V1_ESCWE|nr:Phosphatidylinositol N-acetylglucosaminyltransferase GPI2 subunit [Escovopsis weberi]